MADVLIVDDDVSGADALAELLRRAGHNATCARDVGVALHCLRQREPDLVLLDLGLPRVDGMHLLDAMRDELQFGEVRVAVYTGQDEPHARDAARRLGACDFIVKGGPEAWRQIETCLSAATRGGGA